MSVLKVPNLKHLYSPRPALLSTPWSITQLCPKFCGSDVRPGIVIERKGRIYQVVKTLHRIPGKGGALIQKLRVWCQLQNGEWKSGQIQSLSKVTANVLLANGSGVVYWQPCKPALEKVKELVWEPAISRYDADEGLPELREALVKKGVLCLKRKVEEALIVNGIPYIVLHYLSDASCGLGFLSL